MEKNNSTEQEKQVKSFVEFSKKVEEALKVIFYNIKSRILLKQININEICYCTRLQSSRGFY